MSCRLKSSSTNWSEHLLRNKQKLICSTSVNNVILFVDLYILFLVSLEQSDHNKFQKCFIVLRLMSTIAYSRVTLFNNSIYFLNGSTVDNWIKDVTCIWNIYFPNAFYIQLRAAAIQIAKRHQCISKNVSSFFLKVHRNIPRPCL